MKTYSVTLGSFQRTVELVSVGGGKAIAYLDFLCDRELVRVAALELGKKLENVTFGALVAPATGAIPLCYALAEVVDRPYVILRKDRRRYMQDAVFVGVQSVAAYENENLAVERKYLDLLRRSPVVVLDTVTSSGNTLRAIEALLAEVDVKVATRAVVFVEGGPAAEAGCISCGELPVFAEEGGGASHPH